MIIDPEKKFHFQYRKSSDKTLFIILWTEQDEIIIAIFISDLARKFHGNLCLYKKPNHHPVWNAEFGSPLFFSLLMKFRSEIENGSRHRRARRKFTKVPHEKSFNSQRATNGKTAQKKANSNKMFFKNFSTLST